MAIKFSPGEGFDSDLAALVKRARQPRNPYAEFDYLLESRGKAVARHRAPGPHGGVLGAWYRPQDWDDAGNLVATGWAGAKACDPWANTRAEGFYTEGVTGRRLRVPPLRFEGVEYPDIDPASHAVSNKPVEQSNRPAADEVVLDKAEAALDTALDKAAFDKKAYQRALMRARRATKRVVPLQPYGASTTAPALGAPAVCCQ
jgi:hypothetical protein